MAPAPLSTVFQSTPSTTHNQTGPLWCRFPSGWACARSRPLWVSPTTSPVRLGVSPAAAPTLTGAFTQRFEALFPPRWSPGLRGLLRSPPFVRFICARMWGRRVCQWSDCLPLLSPVSIPPWPHESSPPWLPVSTPPTGLEVCFFFIYLVSDFLAVGVSSGCARRRSVSTYAAILVPVSRSLFIPNQLTNIL